jgi:TPR repeat protein
MQNLGPNEIEQLKGMVRSGNPDVLFGMVRLYDALLPANEKNPDGITVWALYWMRRASLKDHAEARLRLARLLLDGPFYGPAHKEAFEWLKSLENDLNASTVKNDALWEIGNLAKIEHGIMLCEGRAIQRDHVKGVKLIKEGLEYSNQKYGDPGFTSCFQIGELYALGYVQPDEDPTYSDLIEAIKYLEEAKRLFVQGRDNPKYLDFAQKYLDEQKKRLGPRRDLENTLSSLKQHADEVALDPNVSEDIKTIAMEAYNQALHAYQTDVMQRVEERRRKRTYVSPEVEQRMNMREEMERRLAERLAREGWTN